MDKRKAPPSVTDQGDGSATTGQTAATASVDTGGFVAKKYRRMVHDGEGNLKPYDSALGLLARNFVDLCHASQSHSLDLNETSQRLQVPKRRLYDIVNVLEGIGMMVKKSKNTVVWRGFVTHLDTGMDLSVTKDSLETDRKTIDSLHKEEALLDKWISRLSKTPVNAQTMNASDIIDAILYPVDRDAMEMSLSKDTLIDDLGNVQRAFIAIHAPFNATAVVPKPENQSNRLLYVGTQDNMRKSFQANESQVDDDEAASSNSQKPPAKKSSKYALKSLKGAPGAGDRVIAYSLPVAYNETSQKLESVGAHTISALLDTDPETHRVHKGTNLPTSFGRDETISDLFADGEEDE